MGWFKYYELKQLPNFALAGPALALSISGARLTQLSFALCSFVCLLCSARAGVWSYAKQWLKASPAVDLESGRKTPVLVNTTATYLAACAVSDQMRARSIGVRSCRSRCTGPRCSSPASPFCTVRAATAPLSPCAAPVTKPLCVLAVRSASDDALYVGVCAAVLVRCLAHRKGSADPLLDLAVAAAQSCALPVV